MVGLLLYLFMSLFKNVGIGSVAYKEQILKEWADKYLSDVFNPFLSNGSIFQSCICLRDSYGEIVWDKDLKHPRVPIIPYIIFEPVCLSLTNVDFSKDYEFPQMTLTAAWSLTLTCCKHLECMDRYIDRNMFAHFKTYFTDEDYLTTDKIHNKII